MSIRPVDFNGMIQNTHEVAHTKVNEDNKAALQQHNVQTAVVKEERQASSTVQDMEESRQHEYNYGEGGGNGAFSGGKKRKKKSWKDDKDKKSDGTVVLKNSHPSFDMKI